MAPPLPTAPLLSQKIQDPLTHTLAFVPGIKPALVQELVPPTHPTYTVFCLSTVNSKPPDLKIYFDANEKS